MPYLAKSAEGAVEKLLSSDEQQLYEQLGIRAKAMAEDPIKGASFDPEVVYDAAIMGLKDDVLRLGESIFNRWNLEAYKLICGSAKNDRESQKRILDAFIDEKTLAGYFAALFVMNFGVAPAIASVIAVLIVRRFFRPALEEFCKVWRNHLA